MGKWMPLILGMILLLAGGWFMSIAIAQAIGWWELVAWTPVEFALGGLVGWAGTKHALRQIR